MLSLIMLLAVSRLWGTAIVNTANVSGYLLPGGEAIFDTTNTVVTDFVKFVRSPETQGVSVDLNDTGYIFVKIENVGSISDSYQLEASILDKNATVKWLIDTGTVNSYDTADYALSITETLTQGETVYLMLQIYVGLGNEVGSILTIFDTIISQQFPDYKITYMDTVLITGDGTPPSVPYFIYPSSGTYANTSTPVFVWNESEDTGVGVRGYIIEVAKDAGFSILVQEDTVLAPDTSYIFSAALQDGLNYVRVLAFDTNFNYSDYDTIYFYVDTVVPGTPTFILPVDTYTTSDSIVLYGYCDSDVIEGTGSYSGSFNKISDTEFSFTATNLLIGENLIGLVVVDTAGNISDTGIMTIYYDPILPVIQSLSISSVNSADTKIFVEFSCYDTHSGVYEAVVKYYKNNVIVDSVSLLEPDSFITTSFNISVIHFDQILVEVSVTDRAGNTIKDSAVAVVANLAPDTPTGISINSIPVTGQVVHTLYPDISFVYSDYENDTIGQTVLLLSTDPGFTIIDYEETFVNTNVCKLSGLLTADTYYIGLSVADTYGAVVSFKGTDSFVYDPLNDIEILTHDTNVSVDNSNIEITATVKSYFGSIIDGYALSAYVVSTTYSETSTITTDTAGVAKLYYAGDTQIGEVVIKISEDELYIYDTISIMLTPGTPSKLFINADTYTLPADNISTTSIFVNCYDTYWNPISGEIVSFYVNLGKVLYDTVVIDSGSAYNIYKVGYKSGTESITATIATLEDTYEIYLYTVPPKIFITLPPENSFVMPSDTNFYVRFTKEIDSSLITDSAIIAQNNDSVLSTSIYSIDTDAFSFQILSRLNPSSILYIKFDTVCIVDLGGNYLSGKNIVSYNVLAENTKRNIVYETGGRIRVIVDTAAIDRPYFVSIEDKSSEQDLINATTIQTRGPYIKKIKDEYYDITIVDSILQQISTFVKDINITFYYDDIDNDGKVDNTQYSENYLKLFYFDESENRWRVILNSTVDPVNNYVWTNIDHLTKFSIFYFVQPKEIDKNFAPYPNPFYPQSNDPSKNKIILYHFLTKPARVRIRIFTAGGHLVKDFGWKDEEADMSVEKMPRWDGRNADGELVISGVYYAVLDVEYKDGTKARGIQKILLLK